MSSLAARRAARRPALYAKLEQMALPLSPLVQYDTGRTHAAFPRSMLQFLLLTDDQLESLASFYHQRTPNALHYCYPCPVSWPRQGLSLQDKRRKFGKFIGLRGCETPRLSGGGCSGSGNSTFPSPPRCPGNCQTLWDVPVDSPYFCYDCAMREVQQILDAPEAASTTNTATTTTTATTGTLLTVRSRSHSRSRSRSQSRSRKQPATDKSRRPATYALRMRKMASIPPASSNPPPPTAQSSSSHETWSALTRPLTVEEIIDNASRARLEADTDDVLIRRKVGHY